MGFFLFETSRTIINSIELRITRRQLTNHMRRTLFTKLTNQNV